MCGKMWRRALVLLLLKKQGNSTFCKVVKLQGRGVLASKYSCLAQTPCAKTREFGEAEFSDCLPVSALVCVFAFDTGGLGLWLGAFGRSRLYRCQSVPGPPMPCFVAQSFVLASKKPSLVQLPCAKAPEFGASRILGIVCRFSPWNVFPPMKPAF